MGEKPLRCEVIHQQGPARIVQMSFSRPQPFSFETPIFMPVATQGSMKGLTTEQLLGLPHSPPLILGNTYHLGTRPGKEILQRAGGLHSWMHWPHSILTDSGGFQIVSLPKLSEVSEEGVKFILSNDAELFLSPEESIRIQNAIGSNIAMQLDDVIDIMLTGPRVDESIARTIRWLDRMIEANQRTDQAIFAIIQGGLDEEQRKYCAREMVKRKDKLGGFAIGGLVGGETKEQFWRAIHASLSELPPNMPRYVMGVGYMDDIAVLVALGVDMFDCVFPTRTARFGTALTFDGSIHIEKFKGICEPIEAGCQCYTCTKLTKAALYLLKDTPMAGQLLTIHNLECMGRFTSYLREAIRTEKLQDTLNDFFNKRYVKEPIPEWIINACSSANITIKDKKLN